MRPAPRIVVGLGVLLLFVATSWADVLELKTGQRVEGKFKRANSTWVWIEAGGREMVFKRDQVRAIYFGSVPVESKPAEDPFKALKEAFGLKEEGPQQK